MTGDLIGDLADRALDACETEARAMEVTMEEYAFLRSCSTSSVDSLGSLVDMRFEPVYWDGAVRAAQERRGIVPGQSMGMIRVVIK